MKTLTILVTLSLLLLALALVTGLGVAQEPSPDVSIPGGLAGTAFTYQGQINKGGSPYTGACAFQFSLHDALSGGDRVGDIQTIPSADVSDGLFTVVLNAGGEFGATAFNGQARWLEVQVQCEGDADYTKLVPRQALTPAPYAIALPGLRTEQNTTSPNVVGGYWDNAVTQGSVGATIAGGGDATEPNAVQDSDYATVGGGQGNVAYGEHATVGGGHMNLATGPFGSTVGGGESNRADGNRATVGGGQGNVAYGEHPTIGGGWNNHATGGWTTIGGGISNTTVLSYTTIGGGAWNTAGWASTVSGGINNTASGEGATIGGGRYNKALASYSTVAGGGSFSSVPNVVFDDFGTVGGGSSNIAGSDDGYPTSARFATVGGGAGNHASATLSTVPGGSGAVATHWGELAYASGSFITPGSAQTSVYVLRNTTTAADPTELFLNGTSERLTIASNRTLTFDILVVARSSDGTSAGYHIVGAIENTDDGVSFIATPSKAGWEEDGSWDAIVVADDGNDALKIEVNGAADTTIRWVATVRTSEVYH